MEYWEKPTAEIFIVHPAGTVILTEASLGVEAVGKLGRTEGIAAGTTDGTTGTTGTMEVSWGVEAVGTTGRIAGGTTAGRIEGAETIRASWGVEGIETEGTAAGRIEGITGTGAITFVLRLTK